MDIHTLLEDNHTYVRTKLGSCISVLIKGGFLISGVVLYTSLCKAETMHSVLIKGGIIISGVFLYAFLCT